MSEQQPLHVVVQGMLCTLRMLCVLCTQVTEEALDVLLEYQQQMDRVRSDRKHKFALARTFVLPGRCEAVLAEAVRRRHMLCDQSRRWLRAG